MGITYQKPESLTNVIGELQNITSQGNFNQQMKLPAPAKLIQRPVTPYKGLEGYPGNQGGNTGGTGGGDTLARLMRAIRSQESGGNYGATNPSGASGAYQILRSNFQDSGSGWDMEALGRDVSVQEFMNSPQIQDAIARFKMNQYLKNYGGDAAKVAVAWYGGPGAVKNMYSTRTQTGGYPSLAAYWQSILSKM